MQHTIQLGQVSEFARDELLLDARAPERYHGEVEPIDPKAGHIPRAINAPTSENLGTNGKFRSPEKLRARFTALGADPEHPIGSYCGPGTTATRQAAALTLAGLTPAVLAGSWPSQSPHSCSSPISHGRPEPANAAIGE